jgi:hypothetical protein
MSSTMGDTVLLVRERDCGGMDIVCNDDYARSTRASRVWVRSSPTAFGNRTVMVAVDAYQRGTESAFTLRVATQARLPASSCSGPLFDLSEGGAVAAVSPARASTTSGSCGGSGPTSVEDIYVYNGPGGNADFSEYIAGSRAVLYARRADCTNPMREVACSASGSTSFTTLSFTQMMGTPTYLFIDGLGVAGTNYIVQVVRP